MSSRKHTNENVGIVAGGGPAPGINGIISAATIEANNRGKRVIGIIDGFKWLAKGDTSKVQELYIGDTSRIYLRGGSEIGISRESPISSPERLKNTLDSLDKLGIRYLITIGGDGTMYLASEIEKYSGGKIKVAHVPKTIDNNLPLPDNNPTFGFETARHYGTKLVNYLMEDARTTSRWFIVVTMGRKTGHLAHGIGKAAGATLTIIPEDFGNRRTPLQRIIKIIEGSVIKRLWMQKQHGVVVIAEGIVEMLEELDELGHLDKDDIGRLNLSQANIAEIIKKKVQRNLKEKGIEMKLIEKQIGYELRSAPPIPYDLKYTRDLGYSAIKYLLDGGNRCMLALKQGRMTPLKFEDLMDKKTGATKIRFVDTDTESYEVAQKYMIKLEKEDLRDRERLKELADLTNMKPADFAYYFSEIF